MTAAYIRVFSFILGIVAGICLSSIVTAIRNG
jgi:hypothetical protein